MPAARNLLHKSKLNEFVAWCSTKKITTRPGGGDFQVLQVNIDGKMIPIYEKVLSKEHYSIPEKLVPLVKKFIMETKEKQCQNT